MRRLPWGFAILRKLSSFSITLIHLRKAVLKSSSRALTTGGKKSSEWLLQWFIICAGATPKLSSQEERYGVNKKKKGRQFWIIIHLIFSQRMQYRVTKALRNVTSGCWLDVAQESIQAPHSLPFSFFSVLIDDFLRIQTGILIYTLLFIINLNMIRNCNWLI